MPLIPARRAQADLHLRLAFEPGSTLQLSASPSPTGWTADLLIDKAGDIRHEFGKRHISQDAFDMLAERSMVLLSESVPDRSDASPDLGLLLSSLFAEVPQRFRRILGGRTMLMVERPSRTRDGLRIVLASEANDLGDPVAEGDRAIGALLSPGPGSASPEGAIEGQYPRAVRTDSLPAPPGSVFGDRIHAAWAYSPQRRTGRRWWALSLSSHACESDAFRALVDALPSEARAPESGRTIALGLARPAELAASFEGTPWAALSPVSALAHIEALSWSLTLAAPREPEPTTTRIRGRVEVQMRVRPDREGP